MAAYFPEGPHDVVREMAAFSQTTTTQDAILKRRDRINRASVADHLPAITAPTLIIHGRGDGVHPISEARKLAAGIADAELLIYDTDNHMPLPGHPLWPRFLRDFFAFLDTG